MTASPTARDDLDAALAVLRERAAAWAEMALSEKIALLDAMRGATGEVAAAWVAAAAEAKGIDAASPLVGEEWLSGPWALAAALGAYAKTLASIARDGRVPLDPSAIRSRDDGRTVVAVFPARPVDRLLFGGVTADVVMQDGVTRADVLRDAGSWYLERAPRRASVEAVLGAGNIASIAPLDALYKLYAEGRVVALKLNPVNAYLAPFLERVFAPLAGRGFVRILRGGADVGEALVTHENVDGIHVTGSAATHDAILFGTGADAAARKRRDEPRLEKRLSSELGNVSPVIVVPGRWSSADLRFAAEHIATQKLHNAGFNCIAAQVLVVPEEWAQTDALVAEVRAAIARAAPRLPYYPGAGARRDAFVAGARFAERIGDGETSVALLDVDAGAPSDAFEREAFAGVLAIVRVGGSSAQAFFEEAVAFANERLLGTLGASVIVHPRTQARVGAAFGREIERLRYGTIAVNAWPGVAFTLPTIPWGAYPGERRNEIASGTGVVHNAYFLERTEKTILRAPFAPFPRSFANGERTLLPKPPWFITHRRAADVGKLLVEYEVAPSPALLAKIALAANAG